MNIEDEWPYEPSEPEPLCPEHARDELLCGLLREACRLVDEARLYELSTDWYERAKKEVGE